MRGGAVVCALGVALGACAGLSGLTGGTIGGDAGDDAGVASEDGRVSLDDSAPPGDARDDPEAAPPEAGVDAGGALYRRRITIVNNSTTPMPKSVFTVHVPIGVDELKALEGNGKVRTDFNDLRVVGPGGVERDRIVDAPPDVAPVGVNFALAADIAPNATDTSYALYYGDPGAGVPPADGTKVFAVYDDFSNGISPSWLKSGAPTAQAGVLVLRQNQLDGLTTVAVSDKVTIVSAVEASMKVPNPQSEGQSIPPDTFWYWVGYQHTGDFVTNGPWILWIARGKDTVVSEQRTPAACTGSCDGPMVPQTTSFRYYRIERDPTATRFTLDSTLYHTALSPNAEDYSVIVRNFAVSSDLLVDWIRARVRVAPDPTVTLWPEEKLR